MRTPDNWKQAERPGVIPMVSHSVALAMKTALRAVDADIEKNGAVSVETVERVRAALALVRTL